MAHAAFLARRPFLSQYTVGDRSGELRGPSMNDLWFVSDTHFDHANILKFTGDDGALIRPGFCCVNEMNERMIDNWNRVVKHGDHVWHLGDFAMGNRTISHRIVSRLNGRKR